MPLDEDRRRGDLPDLLIELGRDSLEEFEKAGVGLLLRPDCHAECATSGRMSQAIRFGGR